MPESVKTEVKSSGIPIKNRNEAKAMGKTYGADTQGMCEVMRCTAIP